MRGRWLRSIWQMALFRLASPIRRGAGGSPGHPRAVVPMSSPASPMSIFHRPGLAKHQVTAKVVSQASSRPSSGMVGRAVAVRYLCGNCSKTFRPAAGAPMPRIDNSTGAAWTCAGRWNGWLRWRLWRAWVTALGVPGARQPRGACPKGLESVYPRQMASRC